MTQILLPSDIPGDLDIKRARIEKLSNLIADMGIGYDPREVVTAMSIALGCALRANFSLLERDKVFMHVLNIARMCKDQS